MNAPDRDEADLFAYVTGEADEALRMALEQRFPVEPELALRLEQLSSLELLAAAARSAPAAAAPVGRQWSRGLFALAAAAAIAVVGWMWWLRAEPPACEVRLVATAVADDVEAYALALGWSDPLGRSPLRRRGADPAAGVLTAGEFLAGIAPLEAARSEAAFAAPTVPVRGDFVTLRVRPQQECSLVVLRLDGGGGWERVFPAPEAGFGEVTNRFAPGRIHVVPRPVLVANAIDGVSLHAGFDVPSDRAGIAWFVVAVGTQPIAATTLAAIDRAVVAGATGAEEQAGFAAATPTELAPLGERVALRMVSQLDQLELGLRCQGPFRVEAP